MGFNFDHCSIVFLFCPLTSFPMTGNMLYMFPDVKEVAAAAIDTASRMDAGTHRTSQSICCLCIPEVVQISQVSYPQYSCMVYHFFVKYW